MRKSKVPTKEEIAEYVDVALEGVAVSKLGPIVKYSRNGHIITYEQAKDLIAEGKQELVEKIVDQSSFTTFLRILDAIMPRIYEHRDPKEPWES